MEAIQVPTIRDSPEENDDLAPGSRRKTLPKLEVEERGLGVVEALLDQGNIVQIVPEGRPGYVVVPAWLIDDWLDDLREATVERVKRAEADIEAGRVTRYESPEALWAAIEQLDDADDD